MSESPDTRLLDQRVEAALERRGLRAAGGGPQYPDMEIRVARLESNVADIKAILARLAPRIDEIYGRLQAMPTTWQIIAIIGVVNGGILAGAVLLRSLLD